MPATDGPQPVLCRSAFDGPADHTGLRRSIFKLSSRKQGSSTRHGTEQILARLHISRNGHKLPDTAASPSSKKLTWQWTSAGSNIECRCIKPLLYHENHACLEGFD